MKLFRLVSWRVKGSLFSIPWPEKFSIKNSFGNSLHSTTENSEGGKVGHLIISSQALKYLQLHSK